MYSLSFFFTKFNPCDTTLSITYIFVFKPSLKIYPHHNNIFTINIKLLFTKLYTNIKLLFNIFLLHVPGARALLVYVNRSLEHLSVDLPTLNFIWRGVQPNMLYRESLFTFTASKNPRNTFFNLDSYKGHTNKREFVCLLPSCHHHEDVSDFGIFSSSSFCKFLYV